MRKDYTVGYRRPPKHGQFQKGKSGNPKGRPKRQAPDILDRIERVLTTPVTLKTPDGPIRVTRAEALVTNWVALAAKGDKHASRMVLDTLEMVVAKKPPKAESNSDQDMLGPADDEILAAYEKNLLERRKGAKR